MSYGSQDLRFEKRSGDVYEDVPRPILKKQVVSLVKSLKRYARVEPWHPDPTTSVKSGYKGGGGADFGIEYEIRYPKVGDDYYRGVVEQEFAHREVGSFDGVQKLPDQESMKMQYLSVCKSHLEIYKRSMLSSEAPTLVWATMFLEPRFQIFEGSECGSRYSTGHHTTEYFAEKSTYRALLDFRDSLRTELRYRKRLEREAKSK